MKKSILKVAAVAALVLVSASASAQFSVNAGYVSTTDYSKTGNNSSTGDPISGITAGIGYAMEVQDAIGLSWGLNYTYAWNNVDATIVTPKGTSSDHYLDIPIRLTYTLPLGDLKLIGFAGPKFVYAIAGSTKYDGVNETGKHYGVISEILGVKTESPLSRFDIKAGLGVGVAYNALSLKVGYDWGLLNQNLYYNKDAWTGEEIYKNIGRETVTTANHFYVTLGYSF